MLGKLWYQEFLIPNCFERSTCSLEFATLFLARACHKNSAISIKKQKSLLHNTKISCSESTYPGGGGGGGVQKFGN